MCKSRSLAVAVFVSAVLALVHGAGSHLRQSTASAAIVPDSWICLPARCRLLEVRWRKLTSCIKMLPASLTQDQLLVQVRL